MAQGLGFRLANLDFPVPNIDLRCTEHEKLTISWCGRSIFYFLIGLSAAVVVLLVLVMPETLRKIAGNGSLPLHGIYRPLIKTRKRSVASADAVERTPYTPEKVSFRAFLDSFRLLAEKDVLVTLVYGGVIYAVWSMITASTSTLFKEEYQLSDVIIGLIFLPNGKTNNNKYQRNNTGR